MADSTDGTDAALVKRRRFWQLHFSTYVVLLLTSGLLVLVMVPGEFTNDYSLGMGPFNFEHGWPWPYLTRSVALDDNLVRQIEVAFQSSSPLPVLPHHGVPWLQGWGWSFDGDLASQPDWVYGGAQTWRWWALAGDFLVAIGLLLLLTLTLEWRHRHRKLWQFSLFEFAGATLLLSTALGWWILSTQRSQQERELARTFTNSKALFVFEYRGPLWLRRLVGLRRLSQHKRIVSIANTYWHSDTHLRQLLQSAIELPHLESLTIHPNSTFYDGICYVEKLDQLHELNLHIPITDVEVALLRSLRRLQALNITDCRKLTADALQHLSAMQDLETLRLRGSGIDSRGIRFVSQLKKLKLLDLRNTAVDDEGLQHIGQLDHLEFLELKNTKVNGSGLAQLARLQHLLAIDLSGTGVGDDDVDHLKELRSLQSISVRQTPMTKLGLKKLQELHPHCFIRK